MKLEHFNITGPIELLEEVRAFYVDALGLQEGFRPSVSTRGYWLYIGDQAVVHLNENPARNRPPEENFLDHIAFACDNLEEIKTRLERLHIPHKVNHYAAVNFTQIFLHDPAGTGIELNFR